MALQKTLEHPYFDITVPNAYWIIDEHDGIRGNEEEFEIHLNVFTSQAASTKDGIVPIYSITFNFIPSGNEEIITQIYNYAKTLPELNGAIDI